MGAHARLKDAFTEDEKYHNLMRWPFWAFRAATGAAEYYISCTFIASKKLLIPYEGIVVFIRFTEQNIHASLKS